ncbi:hypothetical protein [Dyella acidiphila]|uniref:Uncharacterized protein n=1 Tax=Dyella acidiphila TaxID=2775866 RepID=A0ABR9G9W8_9GAMM|nr:hypothetical protein [Dyella acidiphila]MBE1160809.1 hypothetical protein [Dyella acidiphila]
MREQLAQPIRTALLIMSIFAAIGPMLIGGIMLLISMAFCDSGPIHKCVEAGALFLGAFVLCGALPIPAIFALTGKSSRLGWYLYLYPFLMSALACAAYIEGAIGLGAGKLVLGYTALACVAFIHLLVRPAEAGASNSEIMS